MVIGTRAIVDNMLRIEKNYGNLKGDASFPNLGLRVSPAGLVATLNWIVRRAVERKGHILKIRKYATSETPYPLNPLPTHPSQDGLTKFHY